MSATCPRQGSTILQFPKVTRSTNLPNANPSTRETSHGDKIDRLAWVWCGRHPTKQINRKLMLQMSRLFLFSAPPSQTSTPYIVTLISSIFLVVKTPKKDSIKPAIDTWHHPHHNEVPSATDNPQPRHPTHSQLNNLPTTTTLIPPHRASKPPPKTTLLHLEPLSLQQPHRRIEIILRSPQK